MRGWDGWMASPTRWTWVWASSRSWWWTGRPGVLQSMGSQRVRHDWANELNCTEDEMFGWHHWLPGLECEQTPGVADGQGRLACCSPWGRKESDRTERLNWIKGSKMNTFSCLRLAILGDICKDWIVFLPCFLTSLEVIHHLWTHLLWIWQPGLTRRLFWGASLPSSQSARPPWLKSFLGSTPHLSDSLACLAAGRASLNSVTGELPTTEPPGKPQYCCIEAWMKLCGRSGIGKFSAHVSYCRNFCFTQNKAKEGRGKERRVSGKDGLGAALCREAEQPGAAGWGWAVSTTSQHLLQTPLSTFCKILPSR